MADPLVKTILIETGHRGADRGWYEHHAEKLVGTIVHECVLLDRDGMDTRPMGL
jgi:hypothetical protein